MKKIKLLMAGIGLTILVSSCSLTEDGIVPKDGLKGEDDYGTLDPDIPWHLPPPPPPPPPSDDTTS